MRLRTAKRGNILGTEKETSKTQGKSPSKSMAQPDQPPSNAQIGEGLKMVTRSTFSPRFIVPEFKTDLINNLSSYMEKIEDAR